MANITVDLTEKACLYVEAIYRIRLKTAHVCQCTMDVCKVDLNDAENFKLYSHASRVNEITLAELKAIDDALSALHLAIYDGSVFSDGWPSNFNRIRRFVSVYEGTSHDGADVFRAVLSSFGITYAAVESGITIRYTYQGEE